MSELFFPSSYSVHSSDNRHTNADRTSFQGVLNGENVKLTLSTKSLTESAAEEMSLAKSSRRDKDIGARKINDRGRAKSLAQRYLTKRGAQADNTNRDLAKLFQNQRPATASQIIALLQRQNTDVSYQFAALTAFREYLLNNKKRGGPPLAGEEDYSNRLFDLSEEALARLDAEHGPAIQAGFNILEASLEATDRNQSLGFNRLQTLYRDAVLDYGGLLQTFHHIVEMHGGEYLADALEFLIKALGADLGAVGPSIAIEKLNAVMQDMFKLQTLISLEGHSRELLRDYERICAAEAPPCHRVLEQLLKLQNQKWIMPNSIASVTETLKIDILSAKIFFLQRFKTIARMVPEKCFEDTRNRDKLLQAIQNNVDAMIEEEDA